MVHSCFSLTQWLLNRAASKLLRQLLASWIRKLHMDRTNGTPIARARTGVARSLEDPVASAVSTASTPTSQQTLETRTESSGQHSSAPRPASAQSQLADHNFVASAVASPAELLAIREKLADEVHNKPIARWKWSGSWSKIENLQRWRMCTKLRVRENGKIVLYWRCLCSVPDVDSPRAPDGSCLFQLPAGHQSNTKALRAHLKKNHSLQFSPDVVQDMKQEYSRMLLKNEREGQNAASRAEQAASRLRAAGREDDTSGSMVKYHALVQRFCMRFMIWMLATNQPLSVSEHPTFRDMLKEANAGCAGALGSRSWTTRQLLNLDDSVSKRLAHKLQRCDAFSLSLDGWDWRARSQELVSMHAYSVLS